jgi:hypothetical protein
MRAVLHHHPKGTLRTKVTPLGGAKLPYIFQFALCGQTENILMFCSIKKKKKMPSFTRYFNTDKKLIEISMAEMELLIRDEANKEKIAEYVYQRLYNRFLKIFDYEGDEKASYQIGGKIKRKKVFNQEYKNGFIQLAACSLLVETFAAFLTGENETPRGQSSNRFKRVFEYAKDKNNPLKIFENSQFYGKIRCGILHQGETKGKYTVTRNSTKMLNGDEINAYRFHKELKNLLCAYRDELKAIDWIDRKWDACRMKIQHIIDNSK